MSLLGCTFLYAVLEDGWGTRYGDGTWLIEKLLSIDGLNGAPGLGVV